MKQLIRPVTLAALGAITLTAASALFPGDFKGLAAVLWPVTIACAIYNLRLDISGLLQRLGRDAPTGAEFSEMSVSAQKTAMPTDEAVMSPHPTRLSRRASRRVPNPFRAS